MLNGAFLLFIIAFEWWIIVNTTFIFWLAVLSSFIKRRMEIISSLISLQFVVSFVHFTVNRCAVKRLSFFSVCFKIRLHLLQLWNWLSVIKEKRHYMFWNISKPIQALLLKWIIKKFSLISRRNDKKNIQDCPVLILFGIKGGRILGFQSSIKIPYPVEFL